MWQKTLRAVISGGKFGDRSKNILYISFEWTETGAYYKICNIASTGFDDNNFLKKELTPFSIKLFSQPIALIDLVVEWGADYFSH